MRRRLSKTSSSLAYANSARAHHTLPFPATAPPRIEDGALAIDAHGLTKEFGAFRAVDGVTLKVGYGEIYGLLGANGAGKTTIIKMLCGLLAPTSGTIALAGQTGNLRSASLRRRIGYMSQKFTLYDDLSIIENLRFYAGIYGLQSSERDARIAWVLEISGLRGREGLLTAKLPGGWKQRVAFGAAVMHDPEILFLDEPTSGVDPLARRQFWRLIDERSRAGTAILVTTHYLGRSRALPSALLHVGRAHGDGRFADRDQGRAARPALRDHDR